MFKKNMISIDIGTYTTKIVIGKMKNKNIIIDDAFMVSTPPESYEDGQIKNLEVLKKVIHNALITNKVKEKQMICTLQSTKTITRELILPYVKEDELESMVYFEIEQYLPIRLDEYAVEYKILEEFEENDIKKLRVLVAALPKEMVENHLKLINGLNLKPIALDIHSNTNAKAFSNEITINNEIYSLDKTITLIDLGYEYINITIIDKGIIRFNRLIHQGGKDIDTNIANSFNLSLNDAEERKMEHANLDALNEDSTSITLLNESVKMTIDMWIREIQRIFQYYTSRSRENRIDEIYLHGGSSNIQNVSKYIHANTNIPTFKIDKISNIQLIKMTEDINLENYLNACTALIRR
ncbi:type IV pilus assembly protein PilM [Lutibacter sp. B2]|nr:type IV pilus assembly protein PilM [Lutibacter sp. B2]